MATHSLPDSPALVHFVQISDSLGRLFLTPRATIESLFPHDADSASITIHNPTPRSPTSSITVSEAAALLMQDSPGMDYATAKGIVSRAARTGKVRSSGEGADRRLDAESVAAWRLARRDKALDAAE